MHIIPATDLRIVREMLQAADLPYEDIDQDSVARFYLLQEAGQPVALAGLELHGDAALLRSLVVVPAQRGRGLARQLLDHLCREARSGGASHLYLLTVGAADYFRRLGFHDLPRDRAPAEIRNTREFAQLCPQHADLLCQRLPAKRPPLPESANL
ncbi:MAG: arsenic resistance N-acetyltransferase ArsN2 [Sedimenticola sp.]|nr:arsenic resistance N-acetyltransferase ArsN2 [Sedimenticola sp.]